MPDKQKFVIVGASQCGGGAAETLRKHGFDGRIVLIGAEPERPYERPPLSKEYLRGEEERERIFLRSPDYYDEQEIELRLGERATRLHTREREVELEGGERLAFDRLLIATGGRPRRLPVPGEDLEGVHYLRTVVQSEAIGSELKEAKRAVVVGAGFIGAEVAASAKMMGVDVTLLEIAEAPMERALGREMGEIYADVHRERGVDVRLGTGVERFEGGDRVERVVTSAGDSLDCDLAVVGVGIDPATEIVQGTGIEVGDGITVDERCETSVEGVFAAGDVASFPNPVDGEHIRVEHWANAQKQGAAAARAMLGSEEPYSELPWFFSDQYDLRMQYVGHASAWDEVVLRGDVAGRKFAAFYLNEGLLLATMAIGMPKEIAASRKLIPARMRLTADQLRDEDVDLRKLAAGG